MVVFPAPPFWDEMTNFFIVFLITLLYCYHDAIVIKIKQAEKKTMAKLTDEVLWLAQDIYCRHVAATLAPKGDVQQVAQACIALSSEFFAAYEANQGVSQEAERKELAHELASALMIELRNASPNGSASTEAPATPTEAPEASTKGKMKAPAPKAPGEAPGEQAEAIRAPLPATPARRRK
jgi:hypothetical protein